MKYLMLNIVALAFLVSGVGLLAESAEAKNERTNDTDGRWIVTLEEDSRTLPDAAAEQAVERAGGAVTAIYEHALQGYAVRGASRAELERLPGVATVEPDLRMSISAQDLPTGIDRIDAETNPIAKIDGNDERIDIDVAVIDTGIDRSHSDLNVVAGVDCTKGPDCSRGGDGSDGNGHGTHVAGTIGALDNGYGVVGVAPGARLWAVKVLGDNGSGWLSDIIEGIDYVTANADQIEVANMSLSGTGVSGSYQGAIANSVASGVFYTVAAGNDGKDVYGSDGEFGTSDDTIPAAYPEVAAISALADSDGAAGGNGGDFVDGNGNFYTADDSFAPFSNYAASVVNGNPITSPGGAIDLMLPGVAIQSTWAGGGYHTISGTSMASPHAAGLAALAISELGRDADNDGDVDADDVYAVRQHLIDTAVAQNDPLGLTDMNDPDSNPEPLGYAGSATPSEPQPPVADAGADQTVSDGDGNDQETVTLDGSGSYDPDGTDLSYAWDTDGDGVTDATTAMVDATYPVGGPYTATLTVTDGDGESATDAVSITVTENTAPTAAIKAPNSAEVGTSVSLSADGSEDADGTIQSYAWDFGDGTTGSGVNTSHTYSATGTYNVALTVTDNGGATDSTTATIEVIEPAAVTLTLSGTKEKGQHVVTLKWSGTESGLVDIHRDGSKIESGYPDDNSYVDNTGNRGKQTYTYQVCEADSDTSCSASQNISF